MDNVQNATSLQRQELDAPMVVVSRLSGKERVLALGVRQLLIMGLGLLEDYLDLPRSIVPKHKKS